MNALLSAIRGCVVRGNVYLRRADVVDYLRETAADWRREGGEINAAAAGSLDQIATQLERVSG